MTITAEFNASFYDGQGSSFEVPSRYDVALNGRGYMLDTAHPAFGGQSAYLGRMGDATIPLIRNQVDSQTEPGESSINSADLWPRVQTSWHKGAGQKFLDGVDSDRARFRNSLGLDPWTRGQLRLLGSTASLVATSGTHLAVLRVGLYLYFTDGITLKWALTPYSSWTDAVILNGEGAATVSSIASDGFNVWAALGADGVHTTTRGATTSTHYNALAATLVGYVKGRLMAAVANVLYNVVASGAAPAALFTHPNSDFTWVGFGEGLGQIYAAGYSGDKSLVYRTAVLADGTALAVPVVAGELPDGEIVRSIQGYLGFVAVGTDLGFRLATQDSSGNLTFGPIVQTNTPVRAFEPQGRFIWFGWENYDTTHTGLGRIDLTISNNDGSPAYASDLMAITQGQVSSIATESGGTRVFAVQGVGLFIESATLVASGTMQTGRLNYGIPDRKIALCICLNHKPLVAGDSVTIYLQPDDGGYVLIGTSNAVGTSKPPQQLMPPELSAQQFEVQIVLAGSPTLQSVDFRSYPAATKGIDSLIPILLYDKITTALGDEVAMDTLAEYQLIQSYVGADHLTSFQELDYASSVFVEEFNFQRHHANASRTWWNGTLVLKLKQLGDEG